MGKFSDSNWSILNEYFGVMVSTRTGTQNSYLYAPEHTIVTTGGKYVDLYEDTDEYGYIGHKFAPISISGNIFKFSYDSVTSSNSLVSGITSVTNGSDMYFRKDGYFHTWLVNNYSEYRDYLNTNKRFLYFGKIWPVSTETGNYIIEFEGLKDFMLNALPPINQSTAMEDWLKAYFDGTHHPIYNLTKNIWSMRDSKEIDIRFLEYIANDYGIEIKEDITTELALREWVDNLIYFLKRKGAYTTLYVVFKFLLTNTTNTLNLYERWHARDLGDTRDAPIETDWDDHHILEHYNIQPSGAAGSDYYLRYDPSQYPFYTDNIDIGNTPPTSNLHIHYKFDETTGTTISDSSSGSSSAWFVNEPINDLQWVTGKVNNALEFDGINQYIDTEDTVESVFQSPFSISTWFNVDGFPTVRHGFFGVSDTSVWNWAWGTIDSNGRIRFSYGENNNSVFVTSNSPTLIDGVTGWKNVVFVADGINMYIYLDNVMIKSEPMTGVTMSQFTQTSWNLLVGAVRYNGSILHHFDGKMDDFRIYNRALTTTEISNIYSYNYNVLENEGHPVLSPHYRVEIDLTSEPLGDDYIINETVIDELIRYWEYTKPVSRFVTYTQLIAPDAQIDGTAAEDVSTYSIDETAFLTTKFTGAAYLTSEQSSAGFGVDTWNYEQLNSDTNWTVLNIE